MVLYLSILFGVSPTFITVLSWCAMLSWDLRSNLGVFTPTWGRDTTVFLSKPFLGPHVSTNILNETFVNVVPTNIPSNGRTIGTFPLFHMPHARMLSFVWARMFPWSSWRFGITRQLFVFSRIHLFTICLIQVWHLFCPDQRLCYDQSSQEYHHNNCSQWWICWSDVHIKGCVRIFAQWEFQFH